MSMSIEKALDKIADVLTNTTDDANGSIEYSLSVIADALANGDANELPAVTGSDNGDVLTVVEGAWAKAAPSAGGGVSSLICTPSVSGGICSLDKTFKEIKEAFEAGSPIHILDESVYTTVTIILLQNRTVKDDYGNQFVASSDDGYPCFEV